MKHNPVIKNITMLPVALLIAWSLVSCNQDYTPKPQGYFRITLPQKEYRQLDSVFPYKFRYPVYGIITPDKLAPGEKNWINIEFPSLKGSIHISYKQIEDRKMLAGFLDDSHTLAMKHIPKANSIEQIPVADANRKVYGLVYNIKGVAAASPYQFYLTDSTRHFLRGALYFNVMPNNDSLAPVIDFVKKDIEVLINSLEWK